MMLAHGVGARGDLPLPFWLFVWAAATALIVSFVALGLAWTRPRLQAAASGRRLLGGDASPFPPRVLSQVLVPLAQAAALVLHVVAVWAGLFGANDTGHNLLPVALYVTVWVGMQLLNGVVGDLWRLLSPINTLARLAEGVARALGRAPSDAPQRLGHWPAALGLFVFLFYELAHPTGSEPRTLGRLLLAHSLVTVVLGVKWGAAWVADNEPFAVLFSLLAGMAVFFTRDRQLRLRPPMTGLARVSAGSGTLAALLIVLGGTTYDGFSESQAGRDLLGASSGWSGAAISTLGLLASIGIVAALFGIGIWWMTRVTHLGMPEASAAFTPSLIPIVFGYAIAHYARLLIDEIQTFWFLLSDPGGLGWNLFGGADNAINFNVISPTTVAWLQVVAIVVGHIGAVLVSHDRSVELLTPAESQRSQLTMLLVMVFYSTIGLWLLLNA